jgi:phage-related protein
MEVLYTERLVEFMNTLDDTLASRVIRLIDILKDRGHTLRLPHSKSLGDGLFELRILGNPQIRIIYFFVKSEIILAHIFIKKSMKIPAYEINSARKIKKQYLQEL